LSYLIKFVKLQLVLESINDGMWLSLSWQTELPVSVGWKPHSEHNVFSVKLMSEWELASHLKNMSC
jgi:hypothetical protein